MYMYGYYEGVYLWLMLAALAVSAYSHFKIRRAFNKYSKIKTLLGISGCESAQKVLAYNSVKDVFIQQVQGHFTDYFNPASKTICLSKDVYSKSSIAAVSVAAHEAGHAAQDAESYFPLKLRSMLVPITQFGSNLALPLVFLGIVIPRWSFAINLGIIFFSTAVLFQIITLPVEFNASFRAVTALKKCGILKEEEIKGAQEVLKAAAFTYIAATFSALISLLRLLLIARGRRR